MVVVYAPAVVGDRYSCTPSVSAEVSTFSSSPRTMTKPKPLFAMAAFVKPKVWAEFASLLAWASVTVGRLPVAPLM